MECERLQRERAQVCLYLQVAASLSSYVNISFSLCNLLQKSFSLTAGKIKTIISQFHDIMK